MTNEQQRGKACRVCVYFEDGEDAYGDCPFSGRRHKDEPACDDFVDLTRWARMAKDDLLDV